MEVDAEELRNRYAQALQHAEQARQLAEELAQVPGHFGIGLAYRAATGALLARYATNPVHKLNYLKQSKRDFDRAVKAAPRNAEVRYLRFSIQHHLPLFLGMSVNLDEDREVMLQELAGQHLPAGVKKQIADFLLTSGRCWEEERAQLNGWLSASPE